MNVKTWDLKPDALLLHGWSAGNSFIAMVQRAGELNACLSMACAHP